MSNELNEVVTPEPELAALKARADMLGVKYHPSIGLDTLRAKVNAVVEGSTEASDSTNDQAPPTPPVAPEAPVVVAETESQKRARLKREANKLVRVRVTCMNPAKAEWEGEIFTVGNSAVGTFTKYIPFNADEGWHVPTIILKQIQQRQCQIFTSVRDARGNTTRKGKLIREFSVEIMPDLTTEELQELARVQAAKQSID